MAEVEVVDQNRQLSVAGTSSPLFSHFISLFLLWTYCRLINSLLNICILRCLRLVPMSSSMQRVWLSLCRELHGSPIMQWISTIKLFILDWNIVLDCIIVVYLLIIVTMPALNYENAKG